MTKLPKEIEQMAEEYAWRNCAIPDLYGEPEPDRWTNEKLKQGYLACASALLPDIRMAMEALEAIKKYSYDVIGAKCPADEALAKLAKYKGAGL